MDEICHTKINEVSKKDFGQIASGGQIFDLLCELIRLARGQPVTELLGPKAFHVFAHFTKAIFVLFFFKMWEQVKHSQN